MRRHLGEIPPRPAGVWTCGDALPPTPEDFDISMNDMGMGLPDCLSGHRILRNYLKCKYFWLRVVLPYCLPGNISGHSSTWPLLFPSSLTSVFSSFQPPGQLPFSNILSSGFDIFLFLFFASNPTSKPVLQVSDQMLPLLHAPTPSWKWTTLSDKHHPLVVLFCEADVSYLC